MLRNCLSAFDTRNSASLRKLSAFCPLALIGTPPYFTSTSFMLAKLLPRRKQKRDIGKLMRTHANVCEQRATFCHSFRHHLDAHRPCSVPCYRHRLKAEPAAIFRQKRLDAL